MEWSEIHIPLMVISDGFLGYGTVYPGRLDALMAKEFLDLLNRHTGCEQVCGAGPSEPVGMDAFHAGRAADTVYDVFQTAAGKAVMGSLTADKKEH